MGTSGAAATGSAATSAVPNSRANRRPGRKAKYHAARAMRSMLMPGPEADNGSAKFQSGPLPHCVFDLASDAPADPRHLELRARRRGRYGFRLVEANLHG